MYILLLLLIRLIKSSTWSSIPADSVFHLRIYNDLSSTPCISFNCNSLASLSKTSCDDCALFYKKVVVKPLIGMLTTTEYYAQEVFSLTYVSSDLTAFISSSTPNNLTIANPIDIALASESTQVNCLIQANLNGVIIERPGIATSLIQDANFNCSDTPALLVVFDPVIVDCTLFNNCARCGLSACFVCAINFDPNFSNTNGCCPLKNCMHCSDTVCLSCQPGLSLVKGMCVSTTCPIANCVYCENFICSQFAGNNTKFALYSAAVDPVFAA